MTSCKILMTRSGIHVFQRTLGALILTDRSYDFEYEDDDDAEQGGDVDVENKYYNAKQMKGDAPEEAIEEFLGVPALEQEKGDWGFKGLKQAIKLEFKLGKYDKVSVLT
jgi:COP9 signalosome complex subunit 2